MIILQTINKAIDANLTEANQERSSKHKPSGKLSAGRLGDPVQWQVLHSLGVEKAPFDAYTLRKFKRGVDIEDWVLKHVPGLIDSQKFVEYDKTVGYVDAVVDTKDYEKDFGVIPIEVKSVTNSKYKYISKKSPQDSHILQACLYALAMKVDHFGLLYVASDDLRTTNFIFQTKDYSERVKNIIADYQKQVSVKKIPVFEPLYKWQANKKYNPYPEWADLTQEQIDEKVDRLGIRFIT